MRRTAAAVEGRVACQDSANRATAFFFFFLLSVAAILRPEQAAFLPKHQRYRPEHWGSRSSRLVLSFEVGENLAAGPVHSQDVPLRFNGVVFPLIRSVPSLSRFSNS
jgi:hypothetical protein